MHGNPRRILTLPLAFQTPDLTAGRFLNSCSNPSGISSVVGVAGGAVHYTCLILLRRMHSPLDDAEALTHDIIPSRRIKTWSC